MHFDVSITHGVRNVGNANLDVHAACAARARQWCVFARRVMSAHLLPLCVLLGLATAKLPLKTRAGDVAALAEFLKVLPYSVIVASACGGV